MTRSPLVTLAFATGAALATYFLDRQQGARRRAVARDKLYSGFARLDDAGRVGVQDLRNRLVGTVGTLRQRVSLEPVTDEVLAERVRARLGRVVSHPGSIVVTVANGSVTLSGPVLAHERKRLLRAVGRVPGVFDLYDGLEVHRVAGNVPGLQGGGQRPAREAWSPATRLLAGSAGAAVALYALARPSPARPLLLLAGAGLLARAAAADARGDRGLEFTKTVTVHAPVERVFDFWRNFENFPRFMRHVRRVHRNADDTWHWEVAGPLGATVRWDARVTQQVPNERLAWATVPGAFVQHAGIVRFQPEPGGGTRVQIQMSYRPPAGRLGHAVAALFGADPGAELDDDMMRMKALFETGKPARDAAQRRAGVT